MSQKKITLIIIAIVIIASLLIAGGTYAFLTAKTNSTGSNTGSGLLDVDYIITEDITGNLMPTSSKDGGLTSIATAKLTETSIPGAINIYITPTVLVGLNIEALKWEVYGSKDGSIVYTNTGNFNGKEENTPIKIVDAYELSTTETTFNIYIWLDGNLMNESIIGKKFTATITADSVPITGYSNQ